MPIRPAATTGAKSPRLTCQSLMSDGIAKPMSWPSNPSRMIDSAARQTPKICDGVHRPSSSMDPMSYVRASTIALMASPPFLVVDVVGARDAVPSGGAAALRRRHGFGRHDAAAAFAEADGGAARMAGAGAHDHLVAVMQEGALLAGRKTHLLLSAARDLEQRAIALRQRRGDRAAAEQVAGIELAAVRCVMG